MTITKTYLSETLDKAFKKQDERFAQKLMRHFYTKDEIDKKFATKNELKQTRDELKQAIHDGTNRILIKGSKN